jgi:mannose-6-phosphate isomerase-like protein (cupin superfamily)
MAKWTFQPIFANRMGDDELIASGLLDRYILGDISVDEARSVEAAAVRSPRVDARLGELRLGIEQLAISMAKVPPAELKERLLHAIATAAEVARSSTQPPILHAGSKASDFSPWIDRPEMVEDPANDNIFFLPFANNADGLTALVWMRKGAEPETHTDCLEQFLILEGTCDISFNNNVHALKAGDYLKIPLFMEHTVKVTSKETCRIIVQRLAA